jgi:DNA-binding NarL/FixJ family response regulator
MTTRILIVDDCALVRRELRSFLELAGSVAVIGEAVDGWDAIRQAETLQPDIVLMDLEMPGLNGFEATRRLKAKHLAQTVIVFTVYGSAANQQRAKEAGVDAFMIKGTSLQTILSIFDQFTHPEA